MRSPPLVGIKPIAADSHAADAVGHCKLRHQAGIFGSERSKDSNPP
jgi:hypothetical protein